MFCTRRRAQLGLAAAAMVLALALSALLIAPRYSRPVAVADVGTLAPDFQLNDVTGLPVTLSGHRGQAVVLFFASPDSPDSARYSRRVEALAQRYASDSRVKFFAVDVRSEAVDRLLERLDAEASGRTFQTLVDEKAVVAGRYSAETTPFFMVIDPQGIVRYRGPFDDNADFAFATRAFCAEALGHILGAPTAAVAAMPR